MTASGATKTEEVSHVFSVGSGTGVRQPEQVRSNPLHNAAVWKVLKTISCILEIAEPAATLLLEPSQCGPAVEQGV